MHTPIYTARIKALLAARDAAEENMKRVVYAFRNGRRPNPEDIVDARNKWAEALAVVEPPVNQAALDVVIRAAESWQSELTTYIIPADENFGEDLAETAEAHRNEANGIEEAIKALQSTDDSELYRDLKDQLEEVRLHTGDDTPDDEIEALRNALSTALSLLGVEGPDL